MLKLKLQYFGQLMWRADSFEKTLMLGKIEGRRIRGQQRMRWLDGITNPMELGLGGLWFGWTLGVGGGQGGLACCGSWGHKESDTTEWLNWTPPFFSARLPIRKWHDQPPSCLILFPFYVIPCKSSPSVSPIRTPSTHIWNLCSSLHLHCCHPQASVTLIWEAIAFLLPLWSPSSPNLKQQSEWPCKYINQTTLLLCLKFSNA